MTMLKACKVMRLVILLCFLSITVKAQNNNAPFVWGINGHPLTQRDYSNNLDEQISAITDLKLSSYRFDVLLDANGYAKKEPDFIKVLNSLKKNNISALPAVMQSGLKSNNADSVYQIAYQQGKNFGARYGDYFPVVEVNNEGDNKIRLHNTGGKVKQGSYDTVKAVKFIATIKGFIDGLKAVKPNIKITLSVSYIHYYYLELLKENNVNYDIIGCHWYSNMGDITNVKPTVGNVLSYISKRFNKAIWITEFNQFKGTTSVDFVRQNNYITQNIRKIIDQGIIKGFFIYELFDQSSLKKRYPEEACYGLIYKDSSGQYIKKDAYEGYKQFVGK